MITRSQPHLRAPALLRRLFSFLLGLISLAAVPAVTATTPPLSIVTTSVSPGSVGALYSSALAATGGKSPYKWSLATGSALPAGLKLNSSSGAITGSPTTAGSTTATIQVADSSSQSASAKFVFTIDKPASPLAIKTRSLPAAALTVTYSQTIQVSGGTAPYVWSFSPANGPLPAGLTLNPSTGLIGGLPTVTGTFDFLIQVNDSGGESALDWEEIVVNSPPPPLIIATASLPGGSVGVAYAAGVSATGGTPAYVWSVAPGSTLPPGLALNAASGAITGKPTAAGVYPFSIQAADQNGLTARSGYTVTVFQPATALALQSQTLPDGYVSIAYSQGIIATGGTAPYTFSASQGNGLPPGLQLNAATGTLTGAPSQTGTFNFLMTVTDIGGESALYWEQITILPAPPPPVAPSVPLSIASVSLPNGYLATAYAQSVPATGGTPPYTYSFSQGNGLPPGIGLNPADGALTGTPTQTGTYNFLITVTDAGNATALIWEQIIVFASQPVVTTPPPSTGTSPGTGSSGTPTSGTPTTGSTAPVPFPVTTHPRLYITPPDLPRLQSWATPSNAIYQQGMLPVLQKALADYAQCFPNGAPAASYPDFGDQQGYVGVLSEEDALILAFNALIDPSPANRIQYAKDAHDLVMYVLTLAAQGPVAGAPFQDPAFAVGNRSGLAGQDWGLVLDWLYNAVDGQNNPIFSAQDKLTARNAFLIWANEQLNAEVSGGDHPSPIGETNTRDLLPGGNAYRITCNNYYSDHSKFLTMMALSIDPSDDPVVNSALSSGVLGNSLRSYISNVTGAWLYQEFSMYGDPVDVQAAYGLPSTALVGQASGGSPPEGALYGPSMFQIVGQLWALHTAGFDDPSLSGPQIALGTEPIWDRYVKGGLGSLTPDSKVFAASSYLGPVFQMSAYGDMIRLYKTVDDADPYAYLALFEQAKGLSTHLNMARWWCQNVPEGGPEGLLSRISNPWNNFEPILHFMLFDPAAPVPTDPRPTLPTVFADSTGGRIVARTDWTPQATMFDFRAAWNSISHQQADGGQFEFYRNGEWLTKDMCSDDSTFNGDSSVWHNSLGLQNWCPTDPTGFLSWFEPPLWETGSQWILGSEAGDPVTTTSSGPGYAYAQSDLTNLYNRPDFWDPAQAITDIQSASRSILWVNADFIIIYDRAASLHPGLFKTFNLNLVTAPTIAGSMATETTPGGQHLFIQTLLPANPVYSVSGLNDSGPNDAITNVAELEPTTCRMAIQDPTLPQATVFLHVLQGADATTPVTPAAVISSSAGTPYQGAVAGQVAAVFPVTFGSAFAGVTYAVPDTATQQYVTGLVPGASYSATASDTAGTAQISVSPGGSLQADAGGVLTFALSSVLTP